MNQEEWRNLILSRLRERDRHCAQFERIIKSCNQQFNINSNIYFWILDQALADSMQHLMAKNSRLMAGTRRSTAASISGIKDKYPNKSN